MLFSKPTPPKPLQQWYQNLPAIDRLREIVSDPNFEAACAVLLAAAQPSYTNVMHPQSQNAERMCWLSGYNDFLRDLRRLTIVPSSQSELLEWEHIEP